MDTKVESVLRRTRRFIRTPDWILFVLLVLFCNQAMLAVKALGIVLVYVLRPNFRLGLLKGRLPLFYIAAPVVGLVTWFVHVRDAPGIYSVVIGVSTLTWLLCLAATHQIRLSLEWRGAQSVDATLKIFTVANFSVSLFQLVRIGIRTGVLNPYSYEVPFPYGMSSGDHVFGVFGENSYYNMMVSAMLAIYFLFRKRSAYCFLAVTSMLMVFSNIGTLVFLSIVAVLSLLAWARAILPAVNSKSGSWGAVPLQSVRWLGPALVGYAAAFYGLFSPQNFTYTRNAAGAHSAAHSSDGRQPAAQPQSMRSAIRKLDYRKYRPGSSRPPAALASDLQRRHAITRRAIAEAKGKKLSYLETWSYLTSGAAPALLGSGPGRFSSLTAHRISGGDTGRIFSRLPRYHTPVYTENHGLITHYRLQAGGAQLANLNWPESFYNQLLGEYGLIGLLLFLLCYVGHYLRRARRWRWGWWTAALAVPFGVLSYLFEALCPIVFLEVLMELDTFEGAAPGGAQTAVPV